MPKQMPMVSASAKWCSVWPPNSSIESTMIWVEPCVMMVRLMVEVIAFDHLHRAHLALAPEGPRMRSKITTDSLTE